PVRLPQARAGQQRRRDPEVRSADREERERDCRAGEAGPCTLTLTPGARPRFCQASLNPSHPHTNPPMRTTLPLLLLLAPITLLPAQRAARAPDPAPEIERRSSKAAEAFESTLFAPAPLLHKPIQMNFDSAGRLWLACSETYPQIKPGQKANDKIIVLE